MTDERREASYQPIGVIRSPHRVAAGTPIQPAYADQSEGMLRSLEHPPKNVADRIWLVYSFDRAGPFKPRVVPYRDTREHGLFATRSPCRPNPIGISAVRLVGRERNVLHVSGLDILDGTPLLDIKPYVPQFDAHTASRAGWLDDSETDRRLADGRFHD